MGADAVALFRRIPPDMIDDKSYVCVLNACSHSGLVDEAREIFSSIPVKSKWHYTAMVVNRSDTFSQIDVVLRLGRLLKSRIQLR